MSQVDDLSDRITSFAGLGDHSGPDHRLQDATNGLLRRSPAFSAAWGARRWQWLAAAVLVGLLLCGGATPHTSTASQAGALLLMATFASIIAVRCLAVANLFWPQRVVARQMRIPDDALPTYSVLVAVYEEATVIRQLVRGLAALDYPTDKLEIILVAEQDDSATIAAIRTSSLPRHMRLVIVPAGLPRTKPRALNYAIAEASGDYVVVYDAEDMPERGQLRAAIARFRSAPRTLGCLQAQLKIYNPNQTWLTQMFAIEYAALFGLILPALERFGLPMPLGGTSNHFRRHVLESVGLWDPYNVTEDADLGIRLARAGWQVGTLESATWEEAPPSFRDWRRQRMRWQKGWLQTAIVHTRYPARLWRDLGLVRSIAVCIMFASMLLSALVNPLYLASLFVSRSGEWDLWWWAGLVVFLLGYGVSLVVAFVATQRAGYRGPLGTLCLLPLYWLLISLAAYGALYEYLRRPFHWNKTPHRPRAVPTSPSSGLPAEEVAEQLQA